MRNESASSVQHFYGLQPQLCKGTTFQNVYQSLAARTRTDILAEGAIALSVTLSGGALFAS